MSDTSQGPGWWQASDDKWYPPESHANYRAPAPPPPAPPFPGDARLYPQTPSYVPSVAAPPKTNGLAIASFVLSLVWFAGLGSIFAIIFSLVARKNIKESRGSQTGDGLAIAGLVIGIVGILGAALFFVAIAAVDHGVNQLNQQIQSSEVPTYASMGAKVAVGDPENTGIDAVTVESLTMPVTPGSNVLAPSSDKEYAVAKVEVCADRNGSQNGPDDFDFTLGFPDGQNASPSIVPVETPDLGSIKGIAANGCATGYVSFEIATGTTPSYVAYQPGLIHQYRWKTSG